MATQLIRLKYTYGLDPFAEVWVSLPNAQKLLLGELEQAGLENFGDALGVYYRAGLGLDALKPYEIDAALPDLISDSDSISSFASTVDTDIDIAPPSSKAIRPDIAASYDNDLVAQSYDLAFAPESVDRDDPFNRSGAPQYDAQSVVFSLNGGEKGDTTSPDYEFINASFEVMPPPTSYFFGQFVIWQGKVVSLIDQIYDKQVSAALVASQSAQTYFEGLGANKGFADDYIQKCTTIAAELKKGYSGIAGCFTNLANGSTSGLSDWSGKSATSWVSTIEDALATIHIALQTLRSGLAEKSVEDEYAAQLSSLSAGMNTMQDFWGSQNFLLRELSRIALFLDPHGTGSYDAKVLGEIKHYAAFFLKTGDERGVLVVR